MTGCMGVFPRYHPFSVKRGGSLLEQLSPSSICPPSPSASRGRRVMECGELTGWSGYPIGMREVVKLIEMDEIQSSRTRYGLRQRGFAAVGWPHDADALPKFVQRHRACLSWPDDTSSATMPEGSKFELASGLDMHREIGWRSSIAPLRRSTSTISKHPRAGSGRRSATKKRGGCPIRLRELEPVGST